MGIHGFVQFAGMKKKTPINFLILNVQFVDFRTQKMQTRTSRPKLTQESLALRSLLSA